MQRFVQCFPSSLSILLDVRFGWRLLATRPGFTLAAVAAIALGIGVNSMMFTIYNAALFKTLPFENPRQIVHIHSRNLVEGWDRRGVFYEDFLEYRAQARSFEGLAAFMDAGYTVSDERGVPQRIEGCMVTPNTFSLIGQRPLLGRDFRADDGMPEANKVAILSYGLWQTRYGGDQSILGTAVTLSAESSHLGIMPGDMEFQNVARCGFRASTPRETRLVVPPPRGRGHWTLTLRCRPTAETELRHRPSLSQPLPATAPDRRVVCLHRMESTGKA